MTETTEADDARNADEDTFDTFMSLSEGDEFSAVGSEWVVESVEDDARTHARALTAARAGREHEWARFTADDAALSVTADVHDDTHERDDVDSTKHVSNITTHHTDDGDD